MARFQFPNHCPPVPLKVNIPTLLFQQHIIVQLSHPSLILDLPCQLPFLVQALPIRAAWMVSKPADVTLDPPPPQLRSRNDIKEIVHNALAVIGVVCLFCHPIWNERCTSCASSKYLISNSLLFHIFPNIHSLVAFLLLSSNSFQNKANK
jgi:hypothetical protein